jgi:hypothetical protein
LRWSWSDFVEELESGLEDSMAVSSANVARCVLFEWGMSEVNIL